MSINVSKETEVFYLKEYLKRHRHYHTYAHICDVWCTIDEYRAQFSNYEAATLAAIFHDIVYNVDDSYVENELRSVRTFTSKVLADNPDLEAKLDSNIEKSDLQDPDVRTFYLVLIMIGCTKGHSLDRIKHREIFSQCEIDDVKRFLDADLRILSTDNLDKLVEFEEGIRKEFSHYNDEVYTEGRIKVLQSFLDRPKIYLSEIGEPWEKQARENLRFLIERLTLQSNL